MNNTLTFRAWDRAGMLLIEARSLDVKSAYNLLDHWITLDGCARTSVVPVQATG